MLWNEWSILLSQNYLDKLLRVDIRQYNIDLSL